MIIVKLTGGIGNQLFQYAMARRIAYINKVELKLDISEYDKPNPIAKRVYHLFVFKIRASTASYKEISLMKTRNNLFFDFIRPYYKRKIVKEKSFFFDPKILLIKDPVYISGYWQSEKYFSDIKEIIQREIQLKQKFQNELIRTREYHQIINSSSVSIHIRRGDYVSHPAINKRFGVCNSDYYYEAVKQIIRFINNPTFYIFSDDIEWAKSNIKLNYPTYFLEKNKDYIDLILMNKCQANIITNSTFSWWAAWLNKNPQKKVIIPKNWFKDKTIITKDLIPKTWIRI